MMKFENFEEMCKLRGKVANMIATSWKGRPYFRSRPLHVNDPQTPAQQRQRDRFKQAQAFLSPLKGYLRRGFVGYAHEMTEFNAAMSYLLNHAMVEQAEGYAIDTNKLLLSRGGLQLPEDCELFFSEMGAYFSWSDNSGMADAKADDWAMPLLYNVERGEVRYTLTQHCRADEGAWLELPREWVGEPLLAYLAFSTFEGDRTSNSLLLAPEWVEG